MAAVQTIAFAFAQAGTPPPAPIALPTLERARTPEPSPTPTSSPTPMPTPTPRSRGSHGVDVGRRPDQQKISAYLTLDRDIARAAGDLCLTVAVENDDAVGAPLPHAPPWAIVDLSIANAATDRARIYRANFQATNVETRPQVLAGGRRIVLSFNGVTSFALSHWNVRLGPGTYRLRAIPQIGYAPLLDTPRSNTVTFTIR